MNKSIGVKIKQLRTQKKMTLKDLSNETGLSIGFLSQLERGLTNVATDSLEKIANVLDVDLTYFFMKPKNKNQTVMRKYEKEVFDITDNKCINFHLSSRLADKRMFPRIIELLPYNRDEKPTTYIHNGEEFIYILEGTLTLSISDEEIELYPGDSAHYNCDNITHSWSNFTNKITKVLIVGVDNPFRERLEE